jgi:hypothetical protein
VLFGQHHPDEPQDRRAIGEDADDAGAPAGDASSLLDIFTPVRLPYADQPRSRAIIKEDVAMPPRKPKSDVGTALTRLNAVRHGLTSDAPIIPGESLDAWVEFQAGIVEDLAPEGAFEVALAERIATLLWEVRRVSRYERTAIEVALERVPADFADQHRNDDDNPPLSVAEAEQRLADARRCLDIITNLLDTPPVTPIASDDAWSILGAMAEEAEQDTEGFVDGIEAADGSVPWTYGRFIEVLKAIAARDAEAFPALLLGLIATANGILHSSQVFLSEIRAHLDRLYRERSIPSGPTIEAILRYGGTKNRQLYQAITQLEATQSRRAGTPTPLSRVQIFGLPGS